MKKKIESPEALKSLQAELANRIDPQQPCIAICAGTGCMAYGTQKIIDRFREEIAARGLEEKVAFRQTGCHGFCEKGPMVVIHPERIFYQRIGLDDVPEIIEKTVLGGEVIERLLYTDPATKKKVVHEHEVPFYGRQMRLVFGNNGLIEPTSIDDYLAIGGYRALAKVLGEMSPQAVIDEMIASKLRGRGGGGFPTGWKWDATRKAEGEPKYVICNADEGDPGAYMDRSLLEGNPHGTNRDAPR